jgi:hypothetical protein
MAAIRFNGREAVTNFESSSYNGNASPDTETEGTAIPLIPIEFSLSYQTLSHAYR